MKKYILLFIFITSFLNFSFAQNIAPKFEKQNDLTKATYFYDNGTIKEVGYFKNEKLQGKWISYNQEGKITTVAYYFEGKKNGKWFVISNDTVKELTYKSNKLIAVKNLKVTEIPLI